VSYALKKLKNFKEKLKALIFYFKEKERERERRG
jgi:hypothetical protein